MPLLPTTEVELIKNKRLLKKVEVPLSSEKEEDERKKELVEAEKLLIGVV